MAAGTTLALASVGVNAASAYSSFAQAENAREDKKKAEEAARKAMQQARGSLEVNFYDQLSIKKEPYELEREALLTQAQDAMQMAQESGVRGVVGASGRVLAAQQRAQQDITKRMSKELSGLELLQAQEDSRLRDVLAQIDLEEAAGAQQAAADAEAARVAATTQGLSSLGNMATGLMSYDAMLRETSGVDLFGNPIAENWNLGGGPKSNSVNVDIKPTVPTASIEPTTPVGRSADPVSLDVTQISSPTASNLDNTISPLARSAVRPASERVGTVEIGDLFQSAFAGGLGKDNVKAAEQALGLVVGEGGYMGQFVEGILGDLQKYDYSMQAYRPWSQEEQRYLD